MAYPLQPTEIIQLTISGPVTNPGHLQFADNFRFTNIGILTGDFNLLFNEPIKLTYNGQSLPNHIILLESEFALQETYYAPVIGYNANRMLMMFF